MFLWHAYITNYYTFIFIGLGFSDVVQTLRLHRLDIPRTAYVGDSLWLNCSYDLESDDFYAVKWYFNNTEFYSYSNNKPDFFEPPGIHIDVSMMPSQYLFKRVKFAIEFSCIIDQHRPLMLLTKPHNEADWWLHSEWRTIQVSITRCRLCVSFYLYL